MPSTGVNIQVYRQREAEARDAAVILTRCSFCPGWSHHGPAVEGREAAREHRLSAHPDLRVRRRRQVRSLSRPQKRFLTDGEWGLIDAERRRRARLTGVTIEG